MSGVALYATGEIAATVPMMIATSRESPALGGVASRWAICMAYVFT